MKRIVKRVAISIGALLLVFVVLAFIGFRWGLTPIPKAPRGVRLNPLLPPLARENLKPNNGAYYYVKAAELLANYQQSKKSEQQMDALLAGDSSGDTKAIEQTLADCHEALDLCRQGTTEGFAQMPWFQVSVESEREKMEMLGGLRRLARLLVAEGRLSELHENPDRAITNYLATVKLGTDCPRGGTLIVSLVGYAITTKGTEAIRAWVLKDRTSTEELRSLISSLNLINQDSVPYAETLRYQLIGAKGALDNIEAHLDTWQKTNNRRVMFACFDAAFGDAIQDAEKPYWKANPSAIVEKWSPLRRPMWTWAFNRPVPRIMIGMLLPAIESSRSRTLRAQLDVQATVVACALKAHALTYGKLPEKLTELVPDFLRSVPMDPFDGNPLRYRRDENEWVIWSVGSDKKDDNAAWHEFKYRGPNDNSAGGDIFYKSTELQDDLESYKKRKVSKQAS